MNKILLAILCLTLFSCKKANWPDGEGKAEALMNGEKWEAVVNAQFTGASKDTIIINLRSYSRKGFAKHSLYFNIIPYNKGVFDLNSSLTTNRYLLMLDDDAILGDYYLDTSKNNILELKDINYDKGKVEGTFEVTMKERISSKSTFHDFNFPEYFHFTEGKFSFKIED